MYFILTNIKYYVTLHLVHIIRSRLNLTFEQYEFQCARPKGKPQPRTKVVMTYDGLEVKTEGLEENSAPLLVFPLQISYGLSLD
jgi:hypothetical protein